MANPVQIILAATALADQILVMVDRFQRGELSEEELEREWSKITGTVTRAEAIMAKAKELRAARTGG